jgi:apolipoprotein N-acyltransferase
MADHKARWLRFFMRAVAGACFALGLSAIGVFTVPLGVLLVVLLARRQGSSGRELLGLLEGAGVVIALFGALNLDYRSCTSAPVFTHAVRGGGSCGGVDGPPWLAAGVALMLLTAVAYWWLSSPRRSPPSEELSSSLPG